MTDEDAREWYEERAAIIEHDGRHERERAEAIARKRLALLIGEDRTNRIAQVPALPSRSLVGS